MEPTQNYDTAFILAAILIYLFSFFLIIASLMELPFLFEGKRISYLLKKFGKQKTKLILIGFSLLIIIGISIRIYYEF